MPNPEPPDRYATRDGMITLGVIPQADAQNALARLLPRISDAMRLTEKVREILGDRLVADVAAGPGNALLYLGDRENPAFLLSHPVWSLDVNVAPPQAFDLPELPEHLRVKQPNWPDTEPRILPGAHRFPGKLRIAEGPAYVDLSYGDDGTRVETCQTTGDMWTWGCHQTDLPFAVDPYAKPAQTPPIGFYCRADLDADGHDIDTLAQMLAQMDPAKLVKGRVFLPTVMPGGAGGAWMRGLWRLREALWEGRVGEDESGWVVADAWRGRVIAVGPSLQEAFGSWQALVRKTQPLPPFEGAPSSPPPEAPDTAPSVDHDEETGATRIHTGTIHIAFTPRVVLDWPELRPENVPAIAVYLPVTVPIPAGWERYGFTRRVRLIGEHGDVRTAFVRDEGSEQTGDAGSGAYTLIGEGAAAVLDPVTLDEALNRLDVEGRKSIESTQFWMGSNPYTSGRYTWEIPGYRVFDDLGRTPELREGGIAWTSELTGRDLDADHFRWAIRRVRKAARSEQAANQSFGPLLAT